MSFTLPRSSPLPCRCSYVMLLPASPSWNMYYCDVLFFLSTTCWQRMESEGATCTWRPYPSFTGLQTRQLLPPWCRVQKHAANMKATGQSSSSGRSGCHPLLCWKINMTHRQIGEDELFQWLSCRYLVIQGDVRWASFWCWFFWCDWCFLWKCTENEIITATRNHWSTFTSNRRHNELD